MTTQPNPTPQEPTLDVVLIPCVECKRQVEIWIPAGEYAAYRAGLKSIQRAMPSLTPAEREMFLSGICGTCWDKLFPEVEG